MQKDLNGDKVVHGMNLIAAKFVLVVSCVLLLVNSALAEYCATTPPPEGLVERCHSLKITVPERRSELEFILVDWMGSCATKSRRFELVVNNPSVEKVWSLIASYHNTPYASVRIIPLYTEHLTYTQEGETCYGIGRVEFTVWGARGEVDVEGPIEIIDGPPDDLIKEAAAAAEKVLTQSSSPGSFESSKMLNVLHWMKTFGKDFDDTFYNVAPEQLVSDPMRNAPACYREFRIEPQGVGYYCLQSDQVIKLCAWHITPLVVQAYVTKMNPAQFEEQLLGLANRILRARQHFQSIKDGATLGPPCPSVLTLMTDVASRAVKSNTLYYAWEQ